MPTYHIEPPLDQNWGQANRISSLFTIWQFGLLMQLSKWTEDFYNPEPTLNEMIFKSRESYIYSCICK